MGGRYKQVWQSWSHFDLWYIPLLLFLVMQLSALAPHQSSWDLPHWPNMAIAPVRLKINTASGIEREPRGERVMEGEESDKTQESGTESVKGGVGGELLGLRGSGSTGDSGPDSGYLSVWLFWCASHIEDLRSHTRLPRHIIDLASNTQGLHCPAALWTHGALLKLAVNVLTLKIGRKIGLSKSWSTYAAL